ncbi:MAG TPA: cation transporter [Candidatus Paceibacterota bacterium]|nr:cation transporter [Candidatus Paceibacterota bacterium]
MNHNQLLQRGLLLEYITLAWNVVGTAVAVWAGIQAASLSLFGFGIDSAIEIFASIVVVWQLKAINKNNERFALKLIGGAFMALSLYLLVRALQVLVAGVHPQPSVLGAAWLFITAIAMLLLAYGKRKIGKQIPNRTLMEEAIVTLIDGLLALALLVGVLLDMYFGFWWADPVASLILVFLGAREALHIFNGEHNH